MKSESKERDRCRRTLLLNLTAICSPGLFILVGCSHAPDYTIFGSFFPVWIFCAVGGLLLTLGARAVIARTPISEYLAAPVLLYLSLAIFFACVLWLAFYS